MTSSSNPNVPYSALSGSARATRIRVRKLPMLTAAWSASGQNVVRPARIKMLESLLNKVASPGPYSSTGAVGSEAIGILELVTSDISGLLIGPEHSLGKRDNRMAVWCKIGAGD